MKISVFAVATLAVVFSPPGRGEHSTPPPAPVLYHTATVPMREQEEWPAPNAPAKPDRSREIRTKQEAALLKHREEQTLVADELLAKLATSSEVELLALNPDPRFMDQNNSDQNRYSVNEHSAGGFKIIGRVSTKSRIEIEQLSAALKTGFVESSGEAADCFSPRHGIRYVTGGKTYLAVICFQCMQAYLCEIGNEKNRADLLIAGSPEKTFDLLFAKHGLSKAP